jgi:ABC-type transporter Mla MlaB component
MPVVRSGNTLVFTGSLTVEDAGEVKQKLQDLKVAAEPCLDLSRLERFDFSIVQLLLAFVREVRLGGFIPPSDVRLSNILKFFGVC